MISQGTRQHLCSGHFGEGDHFSLFKACSRLFGEILLVDPCCLVAGLEKMPWVDTELSVCPETVAET